MSKFKVGDRVKVVKKSSLSTAGRKENYIGKIFTIKYVNSADDFRYDLYDGFISTNYYWSDDELELVSFTKAHLKDGMVVEYRKGKRRLVFNNTFTGIDGYLEFSEFNDDLTYMKDSYENPRNFDIVKVYELLFVGKLPDMFKDHNLKLLWERKEEPEFTEMTVAEIEEKLGYKIKVVADKE